MDGTRSRLIATERWSRHTRCPYCHDQVGVEQAVQCRGCCVGYHSDCWEALELCATLGCGNRTAWAETWGDWHDTTFETELPYRVLWAACLGGLLGVAPLPLFGIGALAWLPVTLIAGAVAGALLAARHGRS